MSQHDDLKLCVYDNYVKSEESVSHVGLYFVVVLFGAFVSGI